MLYGNIWQPVWVRGTSLFCVKSACPLCATAAYCATLGILKHACIGDSK